MILLHASVGHDGQTHPLRPGKPNFFDALFVDFAMEPCAGGWRYTLFIHPKQDISLDHIELQFQLPSTPPDRFFSDGYQSRSNCKPAKPGNGAETEAGNAGLMPKPSHHCGWTYAWARAPQQGWRYEGKDVQFLFWGALNLSSAHTYFQYEPENNCLRVRHQLAGLKLTHSFPSLDLWAGTGSSEQEVYGRWFEALGKPKNATEPVLAWICSGKNQNSGETELNRFFENNSEGALPFQWVLLAEGWQKTTGDWLLKSESFPGGLALAAQQIHKAGLKAGVEWSPFLVAPQASIVRQWPDGVLKNTHGKPLQTQNGLFILNFYHSGVQEYLNGVMHVFCEKWGFDLVRCIHLNDVAISPPTGKTVGQVMSESLEFLRNACGKMLLLADHVPLGSASEWVDVVRICPDPMTPAPSGMAKYFPWRKKQEVFAGLQTALARWPLHQQLWTSETGAFSLLDGRFTPVQQSTGLLLQVLLGGILWTEDQPKNYSAEQLSTLEDVLQWQRADVLSVEEMSPGVFLIHLICDGEPFTAFINTTSKPAQPAPGVLLEPWESLVLVSSN